MFLPSCMLSSHLIYHEMDLELVGLIGKTLLVEQLLLLVVEQLSNPIPLSITRDVMRSLVGGRGDMYTFS